SPRIWVASGPSTTLVMSSTRMPASGPPLFATSLDSFIVRRPHYFCFMIFLDGHDRKRQRRYPASRQGTRLPQIVLVGGGPVVWGPGASSSAPGSHSFTARTEPSRGAKEVSNIRRLCSPV